MSIFAGDTNYKNFSDKEIFQELLNLKKHSQKTSREKIKELKEESSPADLIGIYSDIISFSDKFLEGSGFNLLRLKLHSPSLFFIKKIQKMGIDAVDLNNSVGKIWHQNEYDSRYLNTPLEKAYEDLRNYIINMIDINGIGIELEDRYYKNGKFIKENNLWSHILDVYEATIRGITRK
jgi:hypothetical protein